jgi:AraC-like DNA-binding protein
MMNQYLANGNSSVLVIDLLNRNNFPLSPDNRKFYITYCLEISVILIQFLIYIIISFSFAQRLLKRGLIEKFPKENTNHYPIRNIVIIISILWLIYVLYCMQTYFRVYLRTRIIEAVFYSLFSYWILYNELRGQKITAINNFITRYKSSGLTIEDAIRYKSTLLDYVSRNELHKDHSISLGKLAKSLSMTPHALSQVINEQLSSNFNDFINSYRVEDNSIRTKEGMMVFFHAGHSF